MTTRYAQLLAAHIGDQKVEDVATRWGVPRWVIDDGLRQKVKKPSDKYAVIIASQLGFESPGRLYDAILAIESTKTVDTEARREAKQGAAERTPIANGRTRKKATA